MKRDRPILAVCICAMFLFAGIAWATNPKSLEIAERQEREGVMTHQEFLKLDDLATKLDNGGSPTDAEVDFAIHLLKSKPIKQDQTDNRYFLVAFYTTGSKHWSARQRDKWFDTAIWMMHQPKPSMTTMSGKTAAIWLFGRVHDKRSLPYLLKFEKDANPLVSTFATREYNAIAKLTKLR